MAYIALSKSNFFHNLSLIEKRVGDKGKIAVVLKDNAYGHGVCEIASLSQEYGITKAVVKDEREANEIIKYFSQIITLQNVPHAVHPKISQIVNCVKDLNNIAPNSKIELKVDTGMHRNGILENELEQTLDSIVSKELVLNGVMTHFSSADMLGNSVFLQLESFKRVREKVIILCQKLALPLPLFHCCNSGATFRLNEHFDMARVGIGIYGYTDYDKALELAPDLRPVMSLYAKKLSSRKLDKGEQVGYSGAYELEKEALISTYDIGYGDGFFRLNENHDYITPSGVKILGKVSMDSFGASGEEEELCVFDDVRTLAHMGSTITYDILAKLHNYIPKKIIH